jgi:hypothetical protein
VSDQVDVCCHDSRPTGISDIIATKAPRGAFVNNIYVVDEACLTRYILLKLLKEPDRIINILKTNNIEHKSTPGGTLKNPTY